MYGFTSKMSRSRRLALVVGAFAVFRAEEEEEGAEEDAACAEGAVVVRSIMEAFSLAWKIFSLPVMQSL